MNESKRLLKRWQLANYSVVKRFTFWNVSAKICNFRVPVNKGVPLTWMKWHPSLKDECYPSVRMCKSFTFWKVSAKVYNFRVPVFKGVPLPWEKWHPSFDDDSWPSVRLWKYSLSEKCVLKYATLGFPFIRGFPSHEWNDTHPLTMAACQVYASEKFRFLKSEC